MSMNINEYWQETPFQEPVGRFDIEALPGIE